ncbi:MAG: phospho-N-acetylmuramoyl-pentapeptide-transferase [Firmicutes bacterium]|nr:phospho-N-acetylmuramoyl-pentapeptide-transferase [Bacillota bacterium]
MLMLTKSIICLMLGFIIAIILGLFLVPLLKKINISQSVSRHLNERHLAKEGTPTMGGFIFIITVLIILTIFLLKGSIVISANFLILISVFLAYTMLGFFDDFIKIHLKNNKGLSILTKFLIEVIIAVAFFAVFMLNGNNTILTIGSLAYDLKYFYGFLILFMLVGSSNAVNITDGLDGLCAGLCAISFLTYGIIAWKSSYIIGYQEIAIFCFVLAGALLGFLFFNFYPAKVFMGDLGSLALGGALASIAIILKCEVSLILMGIVYIIETITSFVQIVSIKFWHKKIFRKSPLHHHMEELDFCESDIIKIFYTISLFFSLIALIYYVWL